MQKKASVVHIYVGISLRFSQYLQKICTYICTNSFTVGVENRRGRKEDAHTHRLTHSPRRVMSDYEFGTRAGICFFHFSLVFCSLSSINICICGTGMAGTRTVCVRVYFGVDKEDNSFLWLMTRFMLRFPTKPIRWLLG